MKDVVKHLQRCLTELVIVSPDVSLDQADVEDVVTLSDETCPALPSAERRKRSKRVDRGAGRVLPVDIVVLQLDPMLIVGDAHWQGLRQ